MAWAATPHLQRDVEKAELSDLQTCREILDPDKRRREVRLFAKVRGTKGADGRVDAVWSGMELSPSELVLDPRS